MKSLISKVKLQLSKFLNYIASGSCPGPGVKPEDWWRFHVDYMEF